MRVSVVRGMTSGDLPGVSSVTNAAFGALHAPAASTEPAGPGIPALFFAVRFAADPGGCFVAVREQNPGRVAGVLISVARGTLGWFGPLAVHPDAQRSGAGGKLVAACMDSWRRRGVRLMGLETYRDSPFHDHFYKKMGFRPSCTGIGFRAQLGATGMPAGVRVGGPLPDLGFLYPGLDVTAEAAATTRCGAGHVLTTGDGVAIVHLESTVQPPEAGFVSFLAAATRDSFERLLGAAEHLSHERGKTGLLTRASSSSWNIIDVLDKRGYQAEALTARMKAGDDPDYDHTSSYYLDNWL
jgi:GNAT superfamily N-acetyltransferase